MAIASLVLGIVSLVICIFGSGFGLTLIGAACGIVGVILGIRAGQMPDQDQNMAKAGLICSAIGTALSLVFFIACVACIGGATTLALLSYA